MDTTQRGLRAAVAVVTLAAATVLVQVAAAAPAAAAIPGLQVVSTASVADSSSVKSVIATCPSGKRVIGTGVYIDGVNGQIVLDDLIPTATSVLATGYEDQDGTSETWWIRAFAVCADPLPGLEIISVTSGSSSIAKSSVASCPSGKRVLGAGAAITGGTGQVVLDAMLPADTSVSSTAYEDFDGSAASWTLTSYAICAATLPGLQIVSVTTPADTDDKVAAPNCPSGTVPLSLGWNINTRWSGTIFPDIAMPTQTGAVVAARMNNVPAISFWSLSVRVVCAAP